MKKQMLTILLIVVGMLLGGGCASEIAGSVALKTVVISGMVGTAGMMTFDKKLYEVLKDYDWFMIDSTKYMPEFYTEKVD